MQGLGNKNNTLFRLFFVLFCFCFKKRDLKKWKTTPQHVSAVLLNWWKTSRQREATAVRNQSKENTNSMSYAMSPRTLLNLLVGDCALEFLASWEVVPFKNLKWFQSQKRGKKSATVPRRSRNSREGSQKGIEKLREKFGSVGPNGTCKQR